MGSTDQTEDEAPLDPAAERLRRKLVRLLIVSGGIMMLGLIAVFAAIVYKLNERRPALDGQSVEKPVEATIAIPPGARILSTSLDGGRALITLAMPDGSTALLLVDLADGSVIGRYRAGAQ